MSPTMSFCLWPWACRVFPDPFTRQTAHHRQYMPVQGLSGFPASAARWTRGRGRIGVRPEPGLGSDPVCTFTRNRTLRHLVPQLDLEFAPRKGPGGRILRNDEFAPLFFTRSIAPLGTKVSEMNSKSFNLPSSDFKASKA